MHLQDKYNDLVQTNLGLYRDVERLTTLVQLRSATADARYIKVHQLHERIKVLEAEINRLKDGVFRIEELVDSVANPAIAAADKEST